MREKMDIYVARKYEKDEPVGKIKCFFEEKAVIHFRQNRKEKFHEEWKWMRINSCAPELQREYEEKNELNHHLSFLEFLKFLNPSLKDYSIAIFLEEQKETLSNFEIVELMKNNKRIC